MGSAQLPFSWRSRLLSGVIVLAVCTLAEAEQPIAFKHDKHTDGVATERTTQGVWRHPLHGGRNCLLMLMLLNGRSLGGEICPEFIEARDLPMSASEIAELARRWDCPVDMRSITPADFPRLPLPAIIHLDGGDTRSGSFKILLRVAPDNIHYIDGASATVEVEQTELFLRKWSGVVMMLKPYNQTLPGVWAIAGLASAISVGLLVRGMRRWSNR